MSVFKLLRNTLFSPRSDIARSAADLPQTTMPVTLPMQARDLAEATAKKVLNVGGNSKKIAIPDHYDGWTHHLLDIDPTGNPDVLCDARTLRDLPGNAYNSVYCSHNLEHYYSHDVIKVLQGFHHILKSDGFVDIRVPDMQAVIQHMVQKNLDIDDVLYETPLGIPITIKDVMYGWGHQIEASGVEFFAHKTGFSEKSLTAVLNKCGFPTVLATLPSFEIRVLAFKQPPSESLLLELGLSLHQNALQPNASPPLS